MDLRKIPTILAFLLLLTPVSFAQDNSNSNDQGEGPLVTTQPKGITPEEIIQKFAAREKDFAQARENYTYREEVTVQTLDGDTVSGEFREVLDVVFDDQGRRKEHVIFSPQPTLVEVQLTPEDFDDIQHRYPFIVTTSDLSEYQILYMGQQREDELNTYVFDLAPKTLQKDKRYFQGRIWVDDRDFQIVKTHGKPVSLKKDEQQFPSFTTWREQVDGKYWFPTYTKADEVLHFPATKRNHVAQDTHIRIIVKYTDFKRFSSNTRILYGDKEIKRDPNDPQQPPQPSPTNPPKD